MAWFDILGGVAGGLNQGLGQLQQAQQAKQVEARQLQQLKLQQAQDLRAQQVAAREAEQARLQEVMGLLSGEDPLSVSTDTLGLLQQKYSDLMPRLVAKNTQTGGYEVKMSPEQRAALKKSRDDAALVARLQTEVEAAPELSVAQAVRAIKQGKMDEGVILQKVPPAMHESVYRALYPQEAFKALSARQLEELKGKTDLEQARITASGRGSETALSPKDVYTFLSQDVAKAQSVVSDIQKKRMENLSMDPNSRVMQALNAELAQAQQALQQAEARRDSQAQNIPGAAALLRGGPKPAGTSGPSIISMVPVKK